MPLRSCRPLQAAVGEGGRPPAPGASTAPYPGGTSWGAQSPCGQHTGGASWEGLVLSGTTSSGAGSGAGVELPLPQVSARRPICDKAPTRTGVPPPRRRLLGGTGGWVPGMVKSPRSRGCDAAETSDQNGYSLCGNRGTVVLLELRARAGFKVLDKYGKATRAGGGSTVVLFPFRRTIHGVHCWGSVWPDVASPAAHTGKAPESGSETGRPSVTAVRSGSKYSPPPRDNRAHGACRMCCGQVVGAGLPLAIWVLAHGSERVPPASPPVRGCAPAAI